MPLAICVPRLPDSYTCVAATYTPAWPCVSVCACVSMRARIKAGSLKPCVTRNESKTRRCRLDETSIRPLLDFYPIRFYSDVDSVSVLPFSSMTVNITHPPMFLFCNVILRLKIRFRSVWTTSFSRRKVETGIWKKIVIDKLRHSHIRNIFSFLPQYYWDISHYRLIAFIVNVNFYLVLYLNSKLYVYIYLLQRYTFNNRIRIKAVNARILSFC